MMKDLEQETHLKKIKNLIQNSKCWMALYILGGLKSLNFKIKSTAHTELNTFSINTETNLKKLINSGVFVGNKNGKLSISH